MANFRKVSLLPEDRLAAFECCLPANQSDEELWRALREAVACFFHEAQQLDALFGIYASRELEVRMRQYLELMVAAEGE